MANTVKPWRKEGFFVEIESPEILSIIEKEEISAAIRSASASGGGFTTSDVCEMLDSDLAKKITNIRFCYRFIHFSKFIAKKSPTPKS